MTRKIGSFLFILFLFAHFPFLAQEICPKREFRAAWIATVGNIDWPSKKGLDAETQKAEFIRILDQIKYDRLNAVIVQIRPSADALFNSPYEDWSRYLSGQQGVAPAPYYDPLEFMIQESHQRGIEFHAWFNPYRALVQATKNPNSSRHVTKQHPEWFVDYGGIKYFDPGIPEVRKYFTQVVMDVVNRYDLDAVHFDDYFYPYRIAHQEFPDARSFLKYHGSIESKDDWRRDNVNKLIEDLSSQIKAAKPYVKFGISPFGVWRNFSKDTSGSRTRAGQTNYDDLYADVLLWLKNGWIDYVLPQLYWEIGHRAADYTTLIDWWSQHANGRHVYIGHALYQLGNGKPAWVSTQGIEKQIQLTRNTENICGSGFYSCNSLLKNKLAINDVFHNKCYKNFALLPLMPWLKFMPPPPPELKLTKDPNGSTFLEWFGKSTNSSAAYYVIYRFRREEKIDISGSEHILEIVSDTQYRDKYPANSGYKYVVTALDRLHNESRPSNVVE